VKVGRILGLVLVSAWLIPRFARAEALVLDERTVAQRAATSSELVASANAETEAAKRSLGVAERARLPDLGVQARYARLSSLPERFRTLTLPGDGGGGFALPQVLDTASLRLVAQVPLTDPFLRLASAAEAAGHATLARKLEARATLVRVELEARTAYLVWLRAARALSVAEEALTVAHTEWKDAEVRVSTGVSAPAKALPFQAAFADATSRKLAADAELAVAATMVRRWLPGETRAISPASEPLRSPSAPVGTTHEPPVLAALASAADAEGARVRSETWAMLPRVSAFGAIDVSAPSPRAFAVSTFTPLATWELGMSLEWSLSSITTNERSVASARHEAALARLRDARTEWRANLASSRAQVEGASARIPAAQEALRVAKAVAEQRRGELRIGTGTALEVVSSEAALVQAAYAVTNAEIELRLAEATRDALEGRTFSLVGDR
jgi:outer membrane protein TolC